MKIFIIYTGGTIGMVEGPDGLQPFDFAHLMDNVPKLKQLGYDIESYCFNPPIDSSNMNPSYYKQIVDVVTANYDKVDGFVILHGTDTMAYTATALSFMLQGLTKPVVITGSQLPIGDIREDGTENLISAVEIAAAQKQDGTPMIQEVVIAFQDHVVRGNRSTKFSSTGFNAFRSFNYPDLAAVDLHITYNQPYMLQPAAGTKLTVYPVMDANVGVLFLFPGITQPFVEAQIESFKGLKGVVLRTFGAGNAPTEQWFLDAMTKLCASGTLVLNITQCPAGGVEEDRYQTGDLLAKAGVLSGYDMTFEAGILKMMHLFGRGLSAADVAKAMAQPIAGEMTL